MKNIDWSNLPFGYMRTDYNVRCYYRNGEWGALELCSEETINLHMAATCLHYGQEGFEGLKAYRGKDGKIRIFRPEANAERLQSTCRGILMPELPTELFVNAVKKVVKANERFIPPYESGAALYIRPLLIGTSAQVGVHPASEYRHIRNAGMPVFQRRFCHQSLCHHSRIRPLGPIGYRYLQSRRQLCRQSTCQ